VSAERQSMVLRGVGVHAERVRLPGGRAVASRTLDVGGVAVVGNGQHARAAHSLESSHTIPGGPAPAEQDAEALALLRDQARRQGYEEGLREGLAVARERGESELARQKERHEKTMQEAVTKLQREQAQASAALTKRFDSICLALRQQLDAQLLEFEQQAVELAFLSLQKILGAGPLRSEAMRTLVEQQIGALRDAGPLHVHLHPVDLALFARAADGRTQDEGIHWVANARLPVGGCVIQSARGRLDIGLSGQLARLGQVWLDLTVEVSKPPSAETSRPPEGGSATDPRAS